MGKSNKAETHAFMWRLWTINRGPWPEEQARTDHHSAHSQYPTQAYLTEQVSTDMAPTTVCGHTTYSKEHLTPAHKLRKPMVEKLRRDRINTSIEQLKSLLGPEFLRQQPDSKQEKADILEMAVSYLRIWQQQQQQQQQKQQQNPPGTPVPQAPGGDGYARCVEEAVVFLSQCEVKKQSNGRLLRHFLDLQASGGTVRLQPHTLSHPGSPLHQTSPGKAGDRASCSLWRPW